MMTKLSREVRHLQNKWQANTGWPQRLDSVEIATFAQLLAAAWAGQRMYETRNAGIAEHNAKKR